VTYRRPPGKEMPRRSHAQTATCSVCGRLFAWHNALLRHDQVCSVTCFEQRNTYKKPSPNPGKPGEGTANVL